MVDWKNGSFYVGIFIVIATHIAMFFNFIPMSTMLDKRTHAAANLVAAALILYSRYG